MKTVLAVLVAALLLAACANTRDGLSRDSERMGQKIQDISEILNSP